MITFASSFPTPNRAVTTGHIDVPITAVPQPGESVLETVRRLAVSVKMLEGSLICLTAFGPCAAQAPTAAALRRVFGKIDWPLTWVDGHACDGSGLAGLQAVVLPGGQPARVELNGQIVGSVFDVDGFRHCVLGGITPDAGGRAPWDQTGQTLDRLDEALSAAGFVMEDLVRTWFFLDDILSWYKEFNDARSKVYSGIAFRTGSNPASTGVGAKNPAGAAVNLAAWAIQPVSGAVGAYEVASPLQCSACAYGSSFSRAMEITSDSATRLFISGTASIAPAGETLWNDDADRQVKQTMDVVAGILHSRGFGFNDITRATAYFKRRDLAPAFERWRKECKWSLIDPVKTKCDICRDDLLFEFEADACK